MNDGRRCTERPRREAAKTEEAKWPKDLETEDRGTQLSRTPGMSSLSRGAGRPRRRELWTRGSGGKDALRSGLVQEGDAHDREGEAQGHPDEIDIQPRTTQRGLMYILHGLFFSGLIRLDEPFRGFGRELLLGPMQIFHPKTQDEMKNSEQNGLIFMLVITRIADECSSMPRVW